MMLCVFLQICATLGNVLDKQKMFSKARDIYKNHPHSSEWNSMGWEQRRPCVWMLNYLPSLIQKIFAEHLWCVGHQARYKWAKNAHSVSLALTGDICPQDHTHSLAGSQLLPVCSLLIGSFFYLEDIFPFHLHSSNFSGNNPLILKHST